MSERVALYARISEDKFGLEKGVDRQIEDGRRLAADRGWEIVAEHRDNNISALSGRRRDGYARLLADVEAGRVDTIVCYMTSRLWRSRRERAEGMEILRRHRVKVVPERGPALDLNTAAGRMLAGVMGEFDTHESEVKGERVARAALQRAMEGRANGAALYGWRRAHEFDSKGGRVGFHDVEDEGEAPIVCEIVDRLLAGASLKEITADLNARSVVPPHRHSDGEHRQWGTSSVRKIALRPANIGKRVRQGEIVGDAEWPAIIDEGKQARVVALLTDPRRATSRSGARRHLLTYGVGICGVCGSQLRVKTRGGHELYVCEAKGCVGRRRERVDEMVEAVVIRRLARHDVADLFARDGDAGQAARDHANGLRAKLDAAADDYVDDKIDRRQMERITARLRPLIDQAEDDVRRATPPPVDLVGMGLTSNMVAERWSALSVAQRRSVLEVLLTVRILPTRQGRGFDPASVMIEWRMS